MRELAFSILGFSILLGSASHVQAMTAQDIETAGFSGGGFGEGADPLAARLQILLDRHGALRSGEVASFEIRLQHN